MKEKLSVFLDLARKLNKKLSVIPLLYGSLGLQMLVEDDLSPDDIDICVPQHLYHPDERWHDLLKFMQDEGYELTNLHEHFFQKGDIGVNFGVIDGNTTNTIPSIEAFANIDPIDIPILQTDGAIYKLLTLEQYYQVYSKSLEDNYRNREGDGKDKNKIDILKKLLNDSK
jgi:hypothetical protein